MQVLEGAPPSALADVALLLRFLEEEATTNRNFEFVQVWAGGLGKMRDATGLNHGVALMRYHLCS